jgi:transcriptional regulator with XRE-family HTH domain
MYLLKNIKYLTVQKKFTQLKLSKEVGISEKIICHWFDALQTQPSTLHLKKLSDYFKVSIDYLCMEDLTTMSKREITNNYNLIQKRLQHGKQ